jgi:peptidoglycan hydrolase FlgJ
MPDAISCQTLQMQQAINSFNKINYIKEFSKLQNATESNKNPIELKKACQELESLFIFHLLKEMRSTVPKTGFLTGGKGEEFYTSMFDAQVARELASKRGIGLSQLLMERLGPTSGTEENNGGDPEENSKVPNTSSR